MPRSLRPFLWVLLAVGLSLPLAVLLAPTEHAIFDLRLSLRRDTGWPEDLVLVPIDDAGLQKVSAWPWPRSKYAELLDDLRVDGARTLIFDIQAGTPTNPQEDARLARSLARTVLGIPFAVQADPRPGPVLLASALSTAGLPDIYRGHHIGPGDLAAPLEGFAIQALGVGHVNYFRQSDEIIRTQPPLLAVEGMEGVIPSVPLVAWMAQRGYRMSELSGKRNVLRLPSGIELPLYEGDHFLDLVPLSPLPFLRQKISDPLSIPAWEVMERPGAADLKEKLKDKLALVYASAKLVRDVSPTPMGPETPGGLLMAYSIRTLDRHHLPRPLPALPEMALCWLIGLAAAAWLCRRPPAQVATIAAGAALVPFLAGCVLARFDLFPVVVPPAAFFVTGGLFLSLHASRLANSDRKQLRALLAVSQQASARSAGAVRGTAVSQDDVATRRSPGGGEAAEEEAGRSVSLLLGGKALAQPVEIGHYTVERTIGRGGMGALFLARDRHLDRMVALKILEATDREAFHRFRREALAVARINHPNVVQIYEVGQDASIPYLVMEYVPGGSLSDYLRDPDIPSPLPWQEATRIALGIARGLGAAHAVGIVHRDVKPSNILMVARGSTETKIADFGIAKLAGTDSLTREGSFIGTIGYMSPEQATGLAVDARSDVYSLGVTWYRMLTGRSAFEGMTAQVLRTAVTQPVPDPARNAPVPEAVSKLMARLTALDRSERVPDGNLAAAELETLLAGTAKP